MSNPCVCNQNLNKPVVGATNSISRRTQILGHNFFKKLWIVGEKKFNHLSKYVMCYERSTCFLIVRTSYHVFLIYSKDITILDTKT